MIGIDVQKYGFIAPIIADAQLFGKKLRFIRFKLNQGFGTGGHTGIYRGGNGVFFFSLRNRNLFRPDAQLTIEGERRRFGKKVGARKRKRTEIGRDGDFSVVKFRTRFEQIDARVADKIGYA